MTNFLAGHKLKRAKNKSKCWATWTKLRGHATKMEWNEAIVDEEWRWTRKQRIKCHKWNFFECGFIWRQKMVRKNGKGWSILFGETIDLYIIIWLWSIRRSLTINCKLVALSHNALSIRDLVLLFFFEMREWSWTS